MAIEENLNEDDKEENDVGQEKKNRCLLFCIIFLLIMTLPSALAFLAIF